MQRGDMSTLSLINGDIANIKITVEFDDKNKSKAILDFKSLEEETQHALWANLIYREPITVFAYKNQNGELEIDEAVINDGV